MGHLSPDASVERHEDERSREAEAARGRIRDYLTAKIQQLKDGEPQPGDEITRYGGEIAYLIEHEHLLSMVTRGKSDGVEQSLRENLPPNLVVDVDTVVPFDNSKRPRSRFV